MTRVLKGTASLITLALVVVGAPLLLVRIGRWDGLLHLTPSSLLSPVDATALVLSVMTLAAWVAWGVVAASVAAEVIGALSRGRVQIRIPGGGWIQPVVGSLVLAVAGLVPGGVAQAVPSAPPAATATATAAATPSSPTSDGSLPEVSRSSSQAAAPASVPSGRTAQHVVARGDDLWSVAQRHYGDGTQWRQIVKDNHLDPSSDLVVGSVLTLTGLPDNRPDVLQGESASRVPAAVHAPGAAGRASVPATSAPTEAAKQHVPESVVVAPGDTLSGLAMQHLGDADRWPEIHAINRVIISDADHIEPGWRLTMPSSDSPAPRVPAPAPVAVDDQSPTASSPVAPSADQNPGSDAPTAVTPRVAVTASPTRATATAGNSLPSPASAAEASSAPLAVEPVSDDADVDPALVQLGSLGVLLAAAVSAAVAVRRRTQLAQRSAGRRIPMPSEDALDFEAALERAASLAPEAPECAGPSEALLGMRDGEPVLHDLEAARITSVTGDPELVDSALAAIVTSLALQPWSAETSLVVQGDLPWMKALDEPQVTFVGDVEYALRALDRQVSARRAALARDQATGGVPSLEELRADPDAWEAWRPVVHVFAGSIDEAALRQVESLLDGPFVGVAVVLARSCVTGASLEIDAADAARIDGRPPFTPHLVDASARRALFEIFDTAGSVETMPAPWWSDDDLPPKITALRRPPTLHIDEEEPVDSTTVSHPTLFLLGPLELRGCQGEEPSRARRQCIEYCAWIAMNPGRTATLMSRQLLVAEGTRRSNLSRLRSWLGEDPDGNPYLPDAYSGRIELHPAITSDWEHLELLISGGVNRCSTDALADALKLVRGAPLADAAPGQWGWAEAIRVDMVSTIRDVALVLANRAMDEGDLDLARWAAARGLGAAPNDELLLCVRLRTEHLGGNRAEVERLVLQITRGARNLGVDLRDETVSLLQEVMEGRRRLA